MPHFVTGTVVEILEQRPGLQKVTVNRPNSKEPEKAYVLTQLIGDVAPGNRVVMNVTAVDLNLGTGGWHFVHWNLERDEFHQIGPGHVMKLRYTSLQTDTGVAEEHEFSAPETLSRTPVVACLLLSQVAAVAAAYKFMRPDSKLALVVHDQNALALPLSDLVYELKQGRLIDTTITTGQAFGGDYESVNVMSGYAVAKGVAGADAIIVANGHGSVGTGTNIGFSALSLAAALDDAFIYGGRPILSVRWSDSDPRARHRGLSHHTLAVMDRTESVTIAVPEGTEIDHERHIVEHVDVPDVTQLFEKWGINVTTMGRGLEQDPGFFRHAAAAGIVAAHTNSGI